MANRVNYQGNVSLDDLLHMVNPHVHNSHAQLNLARKVRGKGKEMDDPVLSALLKQLELKTEELKSEPLPDPIQGFIPSGLWADQWRRVDDKTFVAMGKKVLEERAFYWASQIKKGKLYWTRKALRLGKKASGKRAASPLRQIRIPLSPAQVIFYQARLDACVTAEAKALEIVAIKEEIKGFFPIAGKRILLQTADLPGQPISGCEVLGLDVHYDSGIWHLDVLLSKGREYDQEKAKKMGIPVDRLSIKEPLSWRGLAPYRAGRKELGLKGKWAVGANLQVLAGHTLTGEEAVMFASSEAIQADRYRDKEESQSPDGLALDVGLAQDMWLYAKACAEKAGRALEWEAACVRYRRWLIEVQPLKDEIYARASAITGDPIRDRLDEADKARHESVQSGAKYLSQTLGMVLSPDQMRALAKVHPLRKIAAAIEDNWTDIPTLFAQAKVGLAKLIEFISALFAKGGRVRHVAAERVVLAPPAPVVVDAPEPIVVPAPEPVIVPVKFEPTLRSSPALLEATERNKVGSKPPVLGLLERMAAAENQAVPIVPFDESPDMAAVNRAKAIEAEVVILERAIAAKNPFALRRLSKADDQDLLKKLAGIVVLGTKGTEVSRRAELVKLVVANKDASKLLTEIPMEMQPIEKVQPEKEL